MHIKTYENINIEKKYWLIPTDDRFEDSLMKIGCDDVDAIEDLNNRTLRNSKYVFILLHNDGNVKDWGWNYYSGNIVDSFSKKHNYIFCGTVNIDEFELVANKYNL